MKRFDFPGRLRKTSGQGHMEDSERASKILTVIERSHSSGVVSMLSAVRKSRTRGQEVDILSKGMSSPEIPLEAWGPKDFHTSHAYMVA